MRDLQLMQAYVLRLRGQRQQMAHNLMVAAQTPDQMTQACLASHEAELCNKIMTALGDLEKDPGDFVERYLK